MGQILTITGIMREII